MTTLQSATQHFPSTHSQEMTNKINSIEPLTQYSAPPVSGIGNKARNSILNLDTFSPVNQNGSYEFDRVLKSGIVQKRTRKTKAWKSIFLVLRPNYLSIYKNQREDKLRHKIQLSDLTAVAILKDPKHRRQHIFGLFSPSRNFHLEAQSSTDAKEWVDLIRKESRVEEEEEEMFLNSPVGNTSSSQYIDKTIQDKFEQRRLHDERLSSSSPETCDIARTQKNDLNEITHSRRPSYTVDYSGNEVASHSDWSDTEFSKSKGPSNNLTPEDEALAVKPPLSSRCGTRNLSQMNGPNVEQDLERIVWQGYLLCLKSKGGVRQWKDSWIVIRCKNITFYKDESEYSPNLIIPLGSIINAVEIDPVSKTKKFCLQLITEEKSYRLCAHTEDALNKSLGAIKCLLAKRRETRAPL